MQVVLVGRLGLRSQLEEDTYAASTAERRDWTGGDGPCRGDDAFAYGPRDSQGRRRRELPTRPFTPSALGLAQDRPARARRTARTGRATRTGRGTGACWTSGACRAAGSHGATRAARRSGRAT